MAETVYSKIADLDTASQPLAGTELIEASQLGASKKVALTNLYGTGWFAKLIAAFSAFKAPDSDHADNADTLGVGEEEPSDFHDATQLTGNIHLDRIPAELTGKNAATATLAATATNALACSGNAATATDAGDANYLQTADGSDKVRLTTSTIPAFAKYLRVQGTSVTSGTAPSIPLDAGDFSIYLV